MHDDALAKFAAFTNDRVGMDDRIVANCYARINARAGMNHNIFSEDAILSNPNKCSDGNLVFG